jgi:hypothetical protein
MWRGAKVPAPGSHSGEFDAARHRAAARCHLAKQQRQQHARRPMPFLLWMPMIVMSGMWEIFEENTRAIMRAGAMPDKE